MDCQQVRRHILEGRAGRRAVRQHLRHCPECAELWQRLEHTEALVQANLPFAVPETLTQRILAAVPEAAEELQALAAQAPTRREFWTRHMFYTLLGLSIPLAFVLGWLFWQYVWVEVGPWIEQLGNLLPLIPDALAYWGSRLGEFLAPLRDALLFILSFLLLGLSFEHALRTLRLRPAAVEHTSSQQ